jgi:hypothetical protein
LRRSLLNALKNVLPWFTVSIVGLGTVASPVGVKAAFAETKKKSSAKKKKRGKVASFSGNLAAGASESHDFQYTVLDSDPDPLVNVVTATGNPVIGESVSEDTVSDTDDCVTDLIHPAIDIVKTVDEDLVPVGTTVTYTYVVTNTGDTTLYDVSVDDDIMGHIGDIPILEPGQSVTLTKDFVVGEDPVTNVATASGEDILGHSVSATDDAVVTPILGENPPPPTTPFTGSDAGRLGLIAMALLGLGATLVAVTRRRRTEDGTA